ncbi:MAG: sulfite exporter TauE/SafE family protein [Planctomycetes bacterium]|nr:sulfite exporter TauE/SafE family protein [Planctomycetota bacterium]
MMLEQLSETLAQAVHGNPWLAPAAAFAGGLLTAANPCVLAMVPLMVGYVAGQESRGVARSFLLSLTFSIGLTIMFAVLFLATWAASSVLKASWWTYVAAGVCLLMGLHLVGLLKFRIPAPAGLQPRRKGFVGALLLGLLFGLVSLPCAGPVLIALLAVIPLGGAAFGALLLVAYSLGHCGLVLAGGTSMGLVQRLADSRGWAHRADVLRRLAGVLILLVGAFLLFS